MIYPNGDKYIGNYENDKRMGKGKLIYKSGASYVGQFNVKFDGAGKFNTINGIVIDAKWENGEIVSGTIKYSGKCKKITEIHKIDYDKGVILENGKVLEDIDNDINENTKDSFTNDLYKETIDNTGVDKIKEKTSNSKKKDTVKTNDTNNDEIIFQEYQNDTQYEGEKENGLPNGEGRCTFNNGDTYEGTWKNGKFDDYGTYTFKNGESYVGEWKDHKMNGIGTYTYKNGDSFLGEWKNNKKHGMGRFIKEDGSIYKGTWENNNLVESVKVN